MQPIQKEQNKTKLNYKTKLKLHRKRKLMPGNTIEPF